MTALVTGASVGIGRDLAIVLAENKHDLVLTARNETQLNQLAEEVKQKFGVRADVIVMDLAKPQAARELFEEVMRRNITIDILINNAGFGGHGRFDREDLDQILGMLQVNVMALTHLTRLFLPGMIERKSGRMMNLASVASFLPGPWMAVYFATKAYVLSLSEAIASELKRTGVTVTAVCPGPTKTEFGKRAGISSAPSFHDGFSMESMPVARIGYRAMMGGRRVVVTGVRNKLMTSIVRFTPRSLVIAATRALNKQR